MPVPPEPGHTAQVLNGRAVARSVRAAVRAAVAELARQGLVPRLDVVIVGNDPASQAYVASKERLAHKLGIVSQTHALPDTTSTEELVALVKSLGADPQVDGVLVQFPLPAGVDADAVVEAIDPAQDVDGLTPYSQGRLFAGRPGLVPCTPAGILRLLDEYAVPLSGRHAVVVGRSLLLGRPVAQLLLARDATVTVCHSRTPDLAAHVARAEILVVGVGRPGLVPGAWIRPGATVIDVGINRIADGTLVGDVDFAGALGRAGAITPVPGGVGPMTLAMLLRNTVLAAARRAGLSAGEL